MKKLLFLLALCGAAQSYAQNVPAYVPTNGLVGWWPFSGNAIDSSGNGNNGTVNGATLTTDRFGNANKAYYFSSSGCATRIDANVNTSSISQALTISFWVLRQGNGCLNPRIWEFCPGPAGVVSSALEAYWYNNSNSLGIDHVTSTGNIIGSTIASPLSNNQWYHVVYVNSLGYAKTFLNGNLISNVISNGNPVIANNFTIGRMGHSAFDAFNGKLDDIGIWNRALTPCEIQALYSGVASTPISNNLITQDTIKACGDSVLVAATSGLNSYSWNTGATTSSVFAKNTGWYKVTGGSTSGCSATDSVFVSILKANILNNDTTVCLGASLTLNAQQAASGTSCTKSGLATNLQNGLVGYWPFCGNANDMSGSNNHGTVIGASLTSDRFGNPNSAYGFNGISNTIDFANPFFNGTQVNAFTFHTVVKANNTSNSPNIWGKTFFWGEVNFAITNTNIIKMVWANTTTGNKYSSIYSNANVIQTGVWYTIDIVFNNSSGIIYLNGLPIATNLEWMMQGGAVLSTTQIESNCNFAQIANTSKMGMRYTGGSPGNYLNGVIDEFAIYNRALSASEVAQLYQTSAYATTYLWSTGATTASINVTPTQTTKYWLQVSNGISTCTDTVTITVQNPAAPAVSNVSYCQGATASVLTATASAGNSLLWYSTATGGAASSTAPTPSTTTVGSTTYYVSQITPQGCESARASLTVTVNALPQASITASKTPIICTGDSVVFSVSPQVAGQSYVWYKDGVIITGATSTSYAAKQSGAYSVRVTNSNGCSITTATSTLNVYPWPTVNAGPDKEVPAGTSVDIITQTTNAQSIAWSPVTGLSCTNCASPTATVNFPIVYIVTVTSAGGCSVSDTVAIQLVCEDDLLYMPNTFTPNGDGENDRFYPMGKGLGEVTVFRIVNRLGQVVYTRSRFAINNASYGWDGTFNGADLGMDVYSYYIEVPCATGQIIKKTGDISLLR